MAIKQNNTTSQSVQETCQIAGFLKVMENDVFETKIKA